jgi:glycosyltransferase involved in cell wall biosynthesis
MRLTLVISSLQRGGAERIISVLAGAWVEACHDVSLITFDDSEAPSYPIDQRVSLDSLHIPKGAARNPLHALYRNAQRVRLLRRLIRRSKPDVVISFLDFTNIVTLLATRRFAIPVVISERANPAYDELKTLWKVLRRWTYPLADALVCQTTPMVEQIQNRIKVAGYAIPNPVTLPAPMAGGGRVRGEASSRTILAMGRLVPQKGFDLLLQAFAKIADRHPHWSIKVLGQGPLREQLQTQAASLGLQERVTFVGAVSDPFQYLRTADLFVFSSRFEGFGNALAEAMACGLASISFDCPAGPSEIIRDGIDGVLVPREDVAGLAAAMDRLMSDANARENLARRAPEVLIRFSIDRILGLWDQVFDEIVPARRRNRLGSRADDTTQPGASA